MSNIAPNEIQAILAQTLPDEYASAGEQTAVLIVNSKNLGQMKPKQLEGGHNLTLLLDIQLLIAATQLISKLAELFFLLKEKLGREPTPSELASDAKQRSLGLKAELIKQLFAICTAVTDTLSHHQ